MNDTIANALDTIQCKFIPYSAKWNSGISLHVQGGMEEKDIFPVQTYDWDAVEKKIQEYVKRVLHDVI